jgi:hypothetical protein
MKKAPQRCGAFFIGKLRYSDPMTKKRWQIAMRMHGASLILLFFVRTHLAVGLVGLPIAKALFCVTGFEVISLLPFSLGILIFIASTNTALGARFMIVISSNATPTRDSKHCLSGPKCSNFFAVKGLTGFCELQSSFGFDFKLLHIFS